MVTRPGELALVLHTHMPYVEGFGTWPFGEEWLWEAIATSYLPLLDVLGTAPITLSLTPVLCDQLEAPGAIERCLRWLREIRPESHRLDIESMRAAGEHGLAAELERSAAEYAAAADRLEGLGGGLLGALAPHASWTSAATHAVLPLLATDAGVVLQVETAIASHRRRFGHWNGGFWLPECAHAPWLDGLLEDGGVHATCVELTDFFGLGAPEHLTPLVSDEGPVLWPIDRETIALVWNEGGYPASGAYRDYHRHTEHRHRVWANDGARYDHDAALALAREHAADFVARVRSRVRDGGVCVCALDTELLGHWWYEGVAWLEAVLAEAARQGLTLTTLDVALGRHEPTPSPPTLPETTWGAGGDLSTWSAPAVADLAWRARTAELAVIRAGGDAPERAVRELLALQASDWAFLATRELAGEYPRERIRGHAEALATALAGEGELDAAVRNLAPDLLAGGWL
ncbi:MAG TPA: 1,4-alpha-glucan branching protein domain-containing protein [Solirubrobacteraceae bacterium]|jgi:1,4-alpha-glucan branching enzyme|nr:1,4-alpha-glucan branching protein domain-containing protein [Solirubrobacteraceae bacterium]